MKASTHNPLHEITHEHVIHQLTEIVQEMDAKVVQYEEQIGGVNEHFKLSAQNLIHYLVFRNHEIRKTQDYLLSNGLSSLAHSEGHTKAQIESVLCWLNNRPQKTNKCDFKTASLLKTFHAEELLGEFPGIERPHIMVTLSAHNFRDTKLMEDMLNEGMSVARINCAHDDEAVWTEMILVLRNAMAKTGRTCKIYMDLAGPKIRIHSIVASKKKHHKKLPIVEGSELILAPDADTAANVQKKNKTWRDALVVEPPEIIGMIKKGEQLFFDDGKFAANVISTGKNHIIIRIARISAKKSVLKPQKGINLPNSNVQIDALTASDKINIPFICKHADMVGFSFVNRPQDVEHLRSEMRKSQPEKQPAIILKIERLLALQNLPKLLLNGMKDPVFGVMIARGDLAVEIGFERMSEIQQEILWICEAAHTPVIWATQVLESLNRDGFATRSEITDAAMAVKAECVMLNKGNYIIETISTLNDILTRQLGHVSKKRYVMRPLGIAKNFINEEV